VAAVGLAGAACKPMTVEQTPVSRPTRKVPRQLDPDVALAAVALEEEQRVLEVLRATVRRHPRLRHTLHQTKVVHRRHVQVLIDAVPRSARPRTGHHSGSGHAAKAAHRPHVPTDAGAALRSLARHEDRLNALGRTSAFSAQSGVFARLLASMAAAAAQQAAALRTSASRGRA
jgi:hypothetical protein